MSRFLLLSAGAAALIAFGMWLGGHDQPVRVEPVAAAHAEPPHAIHPRSVTAPALEHAMPGIADDLRDRDPRVRRAAIADVARSEAPDPQLLLAAARDGDPNVAVAATEGLGRMYRDGRVSARDLLDRIADPAATDKVRVAALDGLGLVASPDSASALDDLLAHGDAIARRSAAILFVHQDPELAFPALASALGDSDELVRANAHDSLRALARGRDLGDSASAWLAWWRSRH